MIGLVTRMFDAITGQGPYSVAVPAMDGALRPNSALDELAALHEVPEADNVAVRDGRIIFTSGARLLAHDRRGSRLQVLETFEVPVSALAARSDGLLAVALDDGSLRLLGASQRHLERIPGAGAGSITALAFDDAGCLLACVGSAQHRASAWKRDLMERRSSGSLWRIQVEDLTVTRLANGLAFPAGVALDSQGFPVVAEAWRHRLLRVRGDGRRDVLLDDLPGYPGRIAAAAGGGYWLAMFARRSQLVEFVLREDGYRRRMMREIREEHWIVPTLRSGRSHLEPIQGGAIRALGIHKPWAPSLSYGLLVRLDADVQPVRSWHSRADGHRHGVTAAVEHRDRVYVACRGDGLLLELATG